jgi:hypothetical protein
LATRVQSAGQTPAELDAMEMLLELIDTEELATLMEDDNETPMLLLVDATDDAADTELSGTEEVMLPFMEEEEEDGSVQQISSVPQACPSVP